jgi:PTS system fructose-specific IIA component/PTS system nitrogen regulatory IIA component
VIIDLHSADQWGAIDELVDSLVATKEIASGDRESIIAAITKREKSMSTGIGRGIALPHTATDLVSEVVFAMGRSKTGIYFESSDAQPVHRVILFLVPTGQYKKHLHILADMARLAQETEF